MKKKKPKKSPGKSPPKGGSSAASPPPPLSDVVDLIIHSDLIVSDAQYGLPAGAVAQQSEDFVDLAANSVDVSSKQIVIVTPLSDPSSVNEISEIALESNSASPQSTSAADHEDPASTACKVASINHSESVTVESSLTSPKSSSTVIPVEQLIGDDKAVPPSPLPLSTAEVIEGPNSLLALAVTEFPRLPAKENSEEGAKAAVEEILTPAKPVLQKPTEAPKPDWCAHAKGMGKRLSKKGEAYTLPSGEACIRIPNSVIEKNRKSWEPFVIGQFYSDPPSQGTLHNIVNGIWSKHHRDIVVSKMEGFSFLFRIPNAATRNRVINQKLWQIEGQTMFVDKWEPGVIPVKPELTSAPIWLELRKVPFQFFNEDGLERIAGLVGHPEFLHPTTANKTNLEVAKVFTVIDPRKPLPEAVNVQFDSGEICRVLVSSPWMPPVCELCKEIGHISKRCPKTPKSCAFCKSPDHALPKCPKKVRQEGQGKKTRRSRSKGIRTDAVLPKDQEEPRSQKPLTAGGELRWIPKDSPASHAITSGSLQVEVAVNSKLGTDTDRVFGETSGSASLARKELQRSNSRSDQSDVQPDSSDVESSDSELEEGEFSKHEPDFEVVRNRKRFSGQKGKRGRGPIIN